MANENVIPAGLPGYVMRKRIEDKATLHKGGMYVGTGEYEIITDKKGNKYQVYKTEELPVGNEGQVLMSTIDSVKWEDQKNTSLLYSYAAQSKIAQKSTLSGKWYSYNELRSQIQQAIDSASHYFPNIIQMQLFEKSTGNCFNLGFVNIPWVAKYSNDLNLGVYNWYINSNVVNNICFSIQPAIKFKTEQQNTLYYWFLGDESLTTTFNLLQISDGNYKTIKEEQWKNSYEIQWRPIQ